MNDLKSRSIDSCIIWKAAGRPRSGPIFNLYRKDKMAYRHGIRARQLSEKQLYTNDLHEALLKKNGKQFWKSWESKFENKKKQTINHVNGITDPSLIADHLSRTFPVHVRIIARAELNG